MNRLAAGTVELTSRYYIWLWADGFKAAAARITGGVTAAGFLAGICLAAPILTIPTAAVWCLAAWHAGPTETREEEADDEPDDSEEEPDILAVLHHLLDDAKAIHLAQIAEYLYDDPAATATVRELCAAAGVPITRGVRVPGRAVSTGVHRRDLPPLPDHSPTDPVAVVGAGQDEQQQHLGREGFIVLPDPDGNPHRHEIRWINQPTRQAS